MLWLLIGLLLTLNAGYAAERSPSLLVLGDSLSVAYGFALEQGWVKRLRTRLDDAGYSFDVVNASISGETTRGALARLADLLEQHKPAIVILELGGNDGLRGLPLAAMRSNFKRLIEQSQLAGAQVLLLGMRLPPNYGKAYTEKFHAVYTELAEEHEVALVPFFLAGVARQAELMQPDGIHPTAAAQQQLLANVWPILQPMLKEQAVESGG